MPDGVKHSGRTRRVWPKPSSLLYVLVLLMGMTSISVAIGVNAERLSSLVISVILTLMHMPLYWALIFARSIVVRSGRVKLNGAWYPLGAVKGMRAVSGYLGTVPQVILEAEEGEEDVAQLNGFSLGYRGPGAERFQKLCKLMGLNPDGSKPGQPVV